ncbi:hypothetical protein BDY19DRAFT_357631 [Irpex rosettiformis]|uniref:Uncharacterized protein n=1 Tax=Irpex rosettiformis TaxID=378272 RepID=A0ACB8TWC6_9APHY|nr:hypothetical protein BDY19DRAFT_357631 [Irpex rosettiformis]
MKTLRDLKSKADTSCAPRAFSLKTGLHRRLGATFLYLYPIRLQFYGSRMKHKALPAIPPATSSHRQPHRCMTVLPRFTLPPTACVTSLPFYIPSVQIPHPFPRLRWPRFKHLSSSSVIFTGFRRGLVSSSRGTSDTADTIGSGWRMSSDLLFHSGSVSYSPSRTSSPATIDRRVFSATNSLTRWSSRSQPSRRSCSSLSTPLPYQSRVIS